MAVPWAPQTRLEFVSALRVLILEHDAMALWRRVYAGLPPDPPEAMPTVAAVWPSAAGNWA
jgi:hypothetical protein